jgi:hypothetical protein
VWDAASGRFKGTLDLTGCDARASALAIGPELFQRCFVGKDQPDKVLEWSMDSVRGQFDSAARQVSIEDASP